jgi:hypothetical protein
VVTRDRKHGDRLNIQSTPTLYINGRQFPGTADFAEDLDDWIKLELELSGGATSAPAVATSAAPAGSVAAPAPSGSATKKP